MILKVAVKLMINVHRLSVYLCLWTDWTGGHLATQTCGSGYMDVSVYKQLLLCSVCYYPEMSIYESEG